MTDTTETNTFHYERVFGAQSALCRRCGEIKPQKDFEYFLTGAQAQARGYARAVKVKIDDGLLCKACRPRRKSWNELTHKEIHTRAVMGDIPVGEAAELRERKKLRAFHAQMAGLENRWKAEMQRAWAPTLDAIKAECMRVNNAVSANRCHPHMVNAPYAKARLAFFVQYQKALQTLRAKLKQSQIRAYDRRRRPWLERWTEYFEDLMPGQRALLFDAWLAIPLDGRRHLRFMPVLMNTSLEAGRIAPAPPSEGQERRRLFEEKLADKPSAT